MTIHIYNNQRWPYIFCQKWCESRNTGYRHFKNGQNAEVHNNMVTPTLGKNSKDSLNIENLM